MKFDPRQLKLGIKTEGEHTSDPHVAKKIAEDHLREFPDYYTHLLKMERNLEKKAMDEIFYASFMDEIQKLANFIKQVGPGSFVAKTTPKATKPMGIFGRIKGKVSPTPKIQQTPQQVFKSKMDAYVREAMEKGRTGRTSTGTM